ncbi:hypothetical protein C8Q72DRAFT_914560 [Fomitopsis betulina]|nr:hypothetical protein C8Q72DRAFT_914560 [Fomitopsis betulina]
MCRKKCDLEELLAQTCNTCNEWFETMQGLMAHQSMSKKCSWYKKGKLKAIFEPSPEQQAKSSSEFAQAQIRQEVSPNTVNWSEDASASQSSRVQDEGMNNEPDFMKEWLEDGNGEHDDVELREEDEEEEDFDEDLVFVQVPGPSASRRQPQAGPSQQTRRRTAIQLDDDEDTRVEDIDEMAGEVIGNGEMVREDWWRHFSLHAGEKMASRKRKAAWTPENPDSKLWHPFESELDWQVGSWAINEEVHKGAVDRLLSIPGFREKLGLWYHNMCALLQKVEDHATGVQGTRIGHVKVIFKLPDTIYEHGSLNEMHAPEEWATQGPLAYVEWYANLPASADPVHMMYEVRKLPLRTDGTPAGEIIPLSMICQSYSVLDKAQKFLLNNWASKYSYQTLW